MVNGEVEFRTINDLPMKYEKPDSNIEETLKPAEFIFLLDCSHSMYWEMPSFDGQGTINSIRLAVKALRLFLHSLPAGSKFNVIAFGTEFHAFFNESQPYNE